MENGDYRANLFLAFGVQKFKINIFCTFSTCTFIDWKTVHDYGRLLIGSVDNKQQEIYLCYIVIFLIIMVGIIKIIHYSLYCCCNSSSSSKLASSLSGSIQQYHTF